MDSSTEQHTNATMSAVITRANGRVEKLGTISADYKNPIKRLWWKHLGLPLANRRIERANRYALKQRS